MAGMGLTWGEDEETRKKLRAALLDNPEQKAYPPDSMGAFKPQDSGLSGPFVKQDPDGTFRNANPGEMSSIFDPSFKGKTVDVLRGDQLSRYGYDEKNGMTPRALTAQETEENRSRRDARLLSAALNAPADEASEKEYRADGSLKSERSSFKSNIPSFLQQVDVFRTPELYFQANRENNARMLQQEGMQQSGANSRAALTRKDNTKFLIQEDQKNVDSGYKDIGKLLDEIVGGTHDRITDNAEADAQYNKDLKRRALEVKRNMPLYRQKDLEAAGTNRDSAFNLNRALDYLNNNTDYNKKKNPNAKKLSDY